MRDLEPSIQNFVFESFTELDGAQLFALSAFYMNGYGCERNVAKALETLEKAAAAGYHTARAYLYRISMACPANDSANATSREHKEELTTVSQGPSTREEYLESYAKVGSRPAFEDLKKSTSPEKVADLHRWLIDVTGGVGASWFDRSEMLHGYTQSQWIQDDWSIEQVKQSSNPSQLIVNKRGDTVLHFVATCGRWKPFKTLILDYKMEVNMLNEMRETPLLCACRAGQGGIAIICLQTYNANASLAAKNGETPLHWLLSFDDQYVEPITKDLLANGANIDAMTHTRVCHSRLPGTIDVDFQLPGTALSWAVHHNRPFIVKTLLQHGANPHIYDHSARICPIDWAAYYHHHECLRVMIDHLEGKVTQMTTEGNKDLRFAVMYGPLVQQAVHAADRFSMILRNGAEFLNRLHATLDLLREKSKLISFQSRFSGSLLYFAVSGAHNEVVEYMFAHNWCVDTLNRPCGGAGRTPVLEAVRWNRRSMFQTLVDHGADNQALAANPFQPHLWNWSALHIFANEGHTKDVSIVHDLVKCGVPVDGVPAHAPNVQDITRDESISTHMSSLSLKETAAPTYPCETPFTVSLRHNAFPLSTTLLSLGANPNALTLTSGLFSSPYPLTPLGHTIISNARFSSARLKYLLALPNIACIVEPARNLTALHRAAMAHVDVYRISDSDSDSNAGPLGDAVRREEVDTDTNADILYELLLRFREPAQLNATCGIRGNTALHLAIEAGNLGAVHGLLRAGADALLVNEDGETAVQIAVRMGGREDVLRRLGG
jgi:ankyrin repeat protein